MSTNLPTRHTTLRSGHLYYNRRVPSHAQRAFGPQVRIRIKDEAEAERLTRRLNDLWAEEEVSLPIDLQTLLAATAPKPTTLTTIAAEYVEVRGIQENPTISSALMLAELSGDMAIQNYSRQDARNFVQVLLERGMRSTSVRRRLNCLSAIFNYAYAEYEVAGRNPFARVMIAREGADRVRRLPFLPSELPALYAACMASEKRLRWAVPVLGETGCRIAEVIGLRRADVAKDASHMAICPHPARRLKTSGSARDLPLVGPAREAMRLLLATCEGEFLFPEYLREGEILATHAGNTLNKWLKRQSGGKTAHCLRHSFRDRLRAVECPLELLDALGGWSSVQGAGRRYGSGYSLEQKRDWLLRIKVMESSNSVWTCTSQQSSE